MRTRHADFKHPRYIHQSVLLGGIVQQ